MLFIIRYEPTLDDWLVLGGGVFIILLVAYLFTKFTKYGGGSSYGMNGDFDNDFDDYCDDLD